MKLSLDIQMANDRIEERAKERKRKGKKEAKGRERETKGRKVLRVHAR